MCVYIYIYIYIYTHKLMISNAGLANTDQVAILHAVMANLRTKILDFRGFDSSRILISSGGILRCTGDLPEFRFRLKAYTFNSLKLHKHRP